MSKKIQLHIPTPCLESWDDMNPVDKGRFCLSCQKKVIDFTGMSDEQLIAYFKKPAGPVCGRFEENQLNRNIQLSQGKLPWIKYFFQFALPAFLFTMKVEAQKQTGKGKIVVCTSKDVVIGKMASPAKENLFPRPGIINGTVVDDNGSPVPYSTVIIKHTKHGAQTDSLGNFSINIEHFDTSLVLITSCIGFQSVEKEVVIDRYIQGETMVIKLKPLATLLGEVTVAAKLNEMGLVGRVGGVVAAMSVERSWIDTLANKIIPSFTKFSIYPNPIIQGQSITIENKKLPEDVYNITFLNLAGQTIGEQQLIIGKKDKIVTNVPATIAGIYFIRLKGSKSRKIYSEKIIVQ